MQDVSDVTNDRLSKLLYAPEIEFRDILLQGQGTRVSVQGRTKKVKKTLLILVLFSKCVVISQVSYKYHLL